MAAYMTVVYSCAVLCIVAFSTVNTQTTQSLNGTQPSTSDVDTEDGMILEKSMDVLFDMVKGFLETVQPKKVSELQWLNISQVVKGNLPEEMKEWKNYTDYLVGFAVCFVVGILFCIIMPFVGCCFCCCRCCGKCGGRKKEKDPKRAKCKRVSYCTIMLILNTIMLAGVVCAFVTNDLFHRYLRNEDNKGLAGRLGKAFTGFDNYVEETMNDVQSRALGAFDTTRTTLVREINTTAGSAVDRVADLVNASSLIQQAGNLSKNVNATQKDLTDVATYLVSLQRDGTDLTAQLNAIKTNLTSTCTSQACNTLDFSQYETDANFSSLNDLSAEAGNVSRSLDMQKFIDQAKDTLDQAKRNATAEIQGQINNSVNTLDNIRSNIEKQIGDFRTQFNQTTKFASNAMKTLNETTSPSMMQYYDYVWYAGIGVSSVYLLIVLCYYLGVLFGMCGERPGYDAPCCNKGIGANFLMAGVGFSFIFSWLLMLLVTLFFIVGGPTFTEFCRYFDAHDPSQIRFIMDPLSQQFNLSQTLYKDPSVKFDLVKVLDDCKQNKAVYKALKLEHVFNLSSLINLKDVDARIDEIAAQNFTLPEISLISPELRNRIDDFGQSGLDRIDFASFDNQLNKTNKKLTSTNLTEAAGQLESAANTATDQTLQGVLRANAQALKELHTTYVHNMTANVNNLKRALNSLKTHRNIANLTLDLVANLNASQVTFNTRRNGLVKEVIVNLTASLKSTTRSTVDDLINTVENNVGRCKPVYDSIYQATDSICIAGLNPLNGLWFSWGWCIFFFIPCIIFAVKLSGLYRREEEYSPEKDFDDQNFSMYGGNQNDTIPLTSMDSRNGGAGNAGGAGYPGVANSGYHAYDDRGRHSSHSNGYGQNAGYPGSKDMPPPAYGANRTGKEFHPPKY
ncbi:prominin-1-like isoform X3 [Haliotis rufescens]|uniref:prominin-1-like isoform X3 n=1 Tax=Haliotis rufescens TaxID=6454 RepID=UPI00201F9E3A|nr:prominin-1-like isoform X3 [Haliotis rufescens]